VWTLLKRRHCNKVRIRSDHFDTEGGYDYVTIGEETYSGEDQIDQIVDSLFTVEFYSDGSVTASGFQLSWECDVVPQSK